MSPVPMAPWENLPSNRTGTQGTGEMLHGDGAVHLGSHAHRTTQMHTGQRIKISQGILGDTVQKGDDEKKAEKLLKEGSRTKKPIHTM